MDQDLRDLLMAWMGDDFEPSRCDELLARLREDEAFRREVVEEVRVFGMVKVVQSAEPRWLRLEDELGWSTQAIAPDQAFADEVVRRLPDDPPRRRSLGPWFWGACGATAAAAAAVFIAVGWLGLTGGRNDRKAPVVAESIAPAATGPGLAMVVRLEGADWEPGGGPRPAEGDLLSARHLALRSGRARLVMLSGVTLTIEGPAAIDLVSIDRVECRRGRLRTHVPEGAEGFVVATPGAVVVDHGTEFALNVDTDGKSRMMVFEGEAEAMVLGESGAPQRSQVVEERQAVEINPKTGHINETSAASESFVTPTALAVPPLVLDAGYADAVKAAKPWGYWRFEELADGLVPNAVAGRPALRATGPVRLSDVVAENRSAVFDGEDDLSYLLMDDQWDLPREPGYAVELWALSEEIKHTVLAGLVEPVQSRHLFLLELTSQERQSLHRPASVRFLHRWPPGGAGGDNLYSSELYVPYRWHHIVAQRNGDRMEVYTDGRLSRSGPLDLGHEAIACRLMLGRLHPLAGRPKNGPRQLVGRIDEVALYDHPLTPEEIRRHHELTKSAGRKR